MESKQLYLYIYSKVSSIYIDCIYDFNYICIYLNIIQTFKLEICVQNNLYNKFEKHISHDQVDFYEFQVRVVGSINTFYGTYSKVCGSILLEGKGLCRIINLHGGKIINSVTIMWWKDYKFGHHYVISLMGLKISVFRC